MNPKSKRPPGPSGRDLGLVAPAGKGDAPRSCFSDDYRNNFDEIQFGPNPDDDALADSLTFKRTGPGRSVKTYK